MYLTPIRSVYLSAPFRDLELKTTTGIFDGYWAYVRACAGGKVTERGNGGSRTTIAGWRAQLMYY